MEATGVTARFRTYLRELREGIRLFPEMLPEMLRLIFSGEYWAAMIQRYVDRQYTYRHYDEWAAWADEARERDLKEYLMRQTDSEERGDDTETQAARHRLR